MSKRLDDIIQDLVYQVISASGDYNYLASANQKHIFAKSRLVSLRRKIANYKKRVEYKYGTTVFPDTLSIEMDLDHAVSSLRSSLEHLAQLLNSVLKLRLRPTIYDNEMDSNEIVNLKRAVKAIDGNAELTKNQNLAQLTSFLNSEMDKDWYKELHRYRIEMFHDKRSEILNHLSPRLDPDMMDELFLIPPDIAAGVKTKRDREICLYCQNWINDIENILYNSFYLLSEYLPKAYPFS